VVVFYGDAVLEVVGEEGVFLDGSSGADVFYFIEGFFESGGGDSRIYSLKSREDLVFEERVVVVPYDVGSKSVGVAEMIPEEFDDGVFKVVFGECHGFFTCAGGILAISSNMILLTGAGKRVAGRKERYLMR